MLTNQKFILFLSLIILSFSAEPEEEDFDKRIEEEPQLIGITKGIVEKTKQTVGLIFQNSKLDPRGFQSLYLRQKKNNAFFIIPLKCKEKMPYAKNIMGVFCDIDLKREKILPGVYKVENVKYKYKYFLDEVTHLEIFKGHQPELIGVREIIESDSHIWIFFNNLEDVVPNLVKAIKFTDGEKEYEFNLGFCQKNYECVFCSCYDSDCFKDLKVNKYEVKHITYNNEIMKPNDRIYFYYATKEVFVYYFPKSIPKKKI